MRIAKRLLPVFLFLLAVMCTGCSHREQAEIKEVITKELDLLKNLDSEAALKYISYTKLFPDTNDDTQLSPEIKEVFPLFFQNFDYKILEVDIDDDKNTASASLRLMTLDAQSLARDFARSQLEREIAAAASEAGEPQETSLTLEERYLLLNDLLKTNDYESVESNCTVKLQKTKGKKGNWEIRRNDSLENSLVGGLMTYLSDPDILSPQDTLAVYLDTLKDMDLQEMSNYLGVESILNTDDEAKNAIAAALVEQVHNNFNYEFQETEILGYKATVETLITTFDSDAILASYQEELTKYLDSTDAVIDGYTKRYQKSYEMLLASIEENTATTTATAEFELTNDGAQWRLKDDEGELGNAIFGTLSTSPVEEE